MSYNLGGRKSASRSREVAETARRHNGDIRGAPRVPTSMAMAASPRSYEMPRGSTESQLAQAFQTFINSAPGFDKQRGVAGVLGSDWDRVAVMVDNGLMPRSQIQSDGTFKFALTNGHSASEQTLYVNRELSAVRKIRISEFSFPDLPATSLPSLLTNRAEFDILIHELRARASGFVGQPGGGALAHFHGFLNPFELQQLLFSAGGGASTAPLDRSLGSIAQWYNQDIVMSPPVNLESLTLTHYRGGQPVQWLPYRDVCSIVLTATSADIRLTFASAHNLVGSEQFVLEDDLTVDGVVYPKLTAFTIAVAGITSTTADVTGFLDAGSAASTTIANVNIMFPGRRVRYMLEFECARLARE
jgi:hypothetical protein